MMERICPVCQRQIFYKSKKNYDKAMRKNTKCLYCVGHLSKHDNFRGHHHTEESNRKKSEKMKGYGSGRTLSEETKKKLSKILKDGFKNGRIHPRLGVEISKELREKISINTSKAMQNPDIRNKLRLAKVKHLQSCVKDGGQFAPTYNKLACKIIDEYGNKHGYTFQHAENGGEYYVETQGYWLDGYDKSRNTAIEYYEKKHDRNVDKDARRQKLIMESLHCGFIIIKYDGNITIENV